MRARNARGTQAAAHTVFVLSCREIKEEESFPQFSVTKYSVYEEEMKEGRRITTKLKFIDTQILTGCSVNSMRKMFARADSAALEPYSAAIAASTCILSMASKPRVHKKYKGAMAS